MNNPSLKLCPKCGKSYIEVRKFNSNYNIYIHKRKEESAGLFGLIDYCIVSVGHVYDQPTPNDQYSKLNPVYRTSKPSE